MKDSEASKENFLTLLWDFIFGIIIIGGMPMSIVALTIILCNTYQKLMRASIPSVADGIIVFLMLAGALVAFAGALRLRINRRKIPLFFFVFEVLIGIVGALMFWSFYGVLTYTIIG